MCSFRGLSIVFRVLCAWAGVAVALVACGGSQPSPPLPVTHSQSFAPIADTFLNSAYPDNNNGASLSIYTGVNGRAGVMRGLIQFTFPATLQGRATVTGTQLRMTVRAGGSGAAGTGTVERLQAVSEPWTEGNGIGDIPTSFTVGQSCGAMVSGATWNQPSCGAGAVTAWSTPGGTAAAAVSGAANTTGVPLEGQVVWDSADSGNAGMNSDVQAWIDSPASNHGWLISSSDEMTAAAAQRFYSHEAGGTTAPALMVIYSQ